MDNPKMEKLAEALRNAVDAYYEVALEEMRDGGDPWVVYRCMKSVRNMERRESRVRGSEWVA